MAENGDCALSSIYVPSGTWLNYLAYRVFTAPTFPVFGRALGAPGDCDNTVFSIGVDHNDDASPLTNVEYSTQLTGDNITGGIGVKGTLGATNFGLGSDSPNPGKFRKIGMWIRTGATGTWSVTIKEMHLIWGP